MKLHHIGMAVPDIKAALDSYRRLGAAVGEPFKALGIDYLLAYVETGGTQIELVQPTSPGNTAARYLETHPSGGIYHLGYEVDDLSEASASLLAFGASFVGTGEPRPEPDGTMVVVLDASKSHGTLIELRQPPRARP